MKIAVVGVLLIVIGEVHKVKKPKRNVVSPLGGHMQKENEYQTLLVSDV
jgi:hypothetical protein